jgi:hypothetical protein
MSTLVALIAPTPKVQKAFEPVLGAVVEALARNILPTDDRSRYMLHDLPQKRAPSLSTDDAVCDSDP